MVTKAALRHLNRRVIRRIGRCVFVLAAWYLIESFQTKDGKPKSRRRAPSASVRPSVASSDPCITERSRDTNTRARASGEHAPSLRFVTFAFTRGRSVGHDHDAEGAEADVLFISASTRDLTDVIRVHGYD